MKKLLKADDISILSVTSGTAIAKEDYEQMIIAASRSAAWVAETEADIVMTHCDTVGGSYTAFKTFTVAPGASEIVQFQVDLVGVKDFFKLASEQNITPADLLHMDVVLADKRDIDTADVEDLPVPAVIHSTLSL